MMKWKKWTANLALIAACTLPMGGCGDSNLFSGASDDSSNEALLDKGLQAIDQEDWDAAVSNLEELYAKTPEDPIVVQNLASAYVGQTGFDTLNLVDAIAEAQDNGTGNSVMYDTVTALFADETGTIPDLKEKIDNFARATSLLVPTGTDPALLTEDTRFEAGLFAAIETILVSSNILEGDLATNIDEDTIDQMVGKNFADNANDLNDSLNLVQIARDDLLNKFEDDSNDIAEDFDDFLFGIGFTENDPVTAPELSAYLKDQ